MLHSLEFKHYHHDNTLTANYKDNVPRLVAIASAPERQYVDQQIDLKKRYNYKCNPYTGAQAASIARRNARERNRVKQVNDGFNALRKRLPASVVTALSGGSRRGSGKKLSKVDTLRMVVEYIRHLQRIVEESDAELGITNNTKQTIEMDAHEFDEGFGGRNSPYSESVASPADSESSSGVSLNISSNYTNYVSGNKQINSIYDDELLDAISWWQQK